MMAMLGAMQRGGRAGVTKRIDAFMHVRRGCGRGRRRQQKAACQQENCENPFQHGQIV